MFRSVITASAPLRRALVSSCTRSTTAKFAPNVFTPAVVGSTTKLSVRFFVEGPADPPAADIAASEAAGEGGKTTGTVKWFDSKKGFGFIQPNDGSSDVFVHHSVIHAEGFRSLADGEEVEFEISVDESGRTSAQNVTGPDGTYVQGRPQRHYNNDDGYSGGYNDRGSGGGGGYGGNGGNRDEFY